MVQEFQKRDALPELDPITFSERQEIEDLAYVAHEGSQRAAVYVQERWQLKRSPAQAKKVFIPTRMQPALDAGDTNVIRDFQLARDVENIFAYARKTSERYCLTGNNLEAPMRRDVLQAKNLADVKRLRTQHGSQARDYELHEYSPKSREQDLFKTDGGFLGIGTAALQAGDEIIIPSGSSRPWTAKKCQCMGFQECREFVGECVAVMMVGGR